MFFPAHKNYSPYAGRNFPTHVFWGDTHLHTGDSMDAGAFGARLAPAGRLPLRARRGGDRRERHAGQARAAARLPGGRRPLRQHGLLPQALRRRPRLPRRPDRQALVRDDPGGRRAGRQGRARGDRRVLARHVPAGAGLAAWHRQSYRSAWEATIKAAEEFNEPGRFTAFIGYEWTSNTGGNNLHRVVIFRDGADQASQVEPYTTIRPVGSDDPKDLWKLLAGLRGQDRRPGARHRAQRQPVERDHVPEIDSFTGQPLDEGVRRDARALGAALRGDPDQGRRRGAPVPLARRRVRRLRDLGQVQPQPERAQGEGHAPVRVRPHGAPDSASSSSRSSAPTPTSSA